jgi:hypothetical protein
MNHKANIAAFLIFAAVVLWFTGVDWSWFLETCHDCGCDREVMQYRVFGHPIQETVYEDRTISQRVAIDLGVACTHPQMERRHKHRWWGLCVCKSPCFNGSYGLRVNTSWYTADVSSRVAALGDRDPTVKTQFVERVLRDHDYAYLRTVLTDAGIDPSEWNRPESEE